MEEGGVFTEVGIHQWCGTDLSDNGCSLSVQYPLSIGYFLRKNEFAA